MLYSYIHPYVQRSCSFLFRNGLVWPGAVRFVSSILFCIVLCAVLTATRDGEHIRGMFKIEDLQFRICTYLYM